MLSSGRMLYGIAVDDAHYFKRPEDKAAPRPGQGWVYVRAPQLESRALVDALERGDFYSSTGVELQSVTATAAALTIAVKTAAQSKYRIQFIGKQGAILSESVTSPATYTFKGTESYVRAKVIESNGSLAWIQPIAGRRLRSKMTPVVVVAAVIERDGCVSADAAARRHAPRRSLGVSRRQGPRERNACRSAPPRDLRGARRGRARRRAGAHRHARVSRKDRRAVLLPLRSRRASAKPMMGQEMRWVRAERTGGAAVSRSRSRSDYDAGALIVAALGKTPFIEHARAFRLARAAMRRAEIHQRLVEVEHVPVRQHRRRHRPQVLLHRVALRIALADEDPEQHAGDVGVEDRGALAEREAADRAGGVFADALERQQRFAIARQLAVVTSRPPAARSTAGASGGCCSRAAATSALTSAGGASARTMNDGYLLSHSWYFGSTRSTCVCCSMISETRMWYGSSVLRHGRSRPFLRYQASRLRRKRWRNQRRRQVGEL